MRAAVKQYISWLIVGVISFTSLPVCAHPKLSDQTLMMPAAGGITNLVPPPSTNQLRHTWRFNVGTLHQHLPHMALPTPSGQPTKTLHLSLRDAVMLALRNNPNVISSELERVVQKYALVVAHNQFEPRYSLTGSATFATGQSASYDGASKISINTPWGGSFSTQYDAGTRQTTINYTQPLIRGFGWDVNTINWYNSLDTEAINKLGFKSTIITTVVTVINNYRSLVQDYNTLSIQRRSLHNTELSLKQSELKYKAGQLAYSDLLQQRANLATQRVSYLQVKSNVLADYQTFLESLGLVATAKISIDQHIDLGHFHKPNLKKVIREALNGNIAYQQALIKIRATRRAVLRAKNNASWKLDLGLNKTFGQGTDSSNGNQSITLSLDIPINNVQNTQGIIDAKIALQQAILSLEETKEELVRNVTRQVQQIDNQYSQVKADIESVKLQKATLKAWQIKFKYGRTTALDVSQIIDTLLQQETNEISDKISLQNLLTTLNQTLGSTLKHWQIGLRY